MLQNTQLLKTFPHADSTGQVTWYSQNDELPLDIPDDEYLFIRKQMSLCKEYAGTGNFDDLNEVFEKTKSIRRSTPSDKYNPRRNTVPSGSTTVSRPDDGSPW